MLYTIFHVISLAVEVLVCLLLLVTILIQRSKSQGMGLAFGSGMGEQMFGSQVGNVLTRATVVLSIVFLVNTTLLGIMGTSRREHSVADSVSSIPAPMAMPQPGPAPAPAAPAPAAGGEFAPVAMDGSPAPDMSVSIPADGSTPPAAVADPEAAPLTVAPIAEPAVEPVTESEPAAAK